MVLHGIAPHRVCCFAHVFDWRSGQRRGFIPVPTPFHPTP
jgi:hypothetical protein